MASIIANTLIFNLQVAKYTSGGGESGLSNIEHEGQYYFIVTRKKTGTTLRINAYLSFNRFEEKRTQNENGHWYLIQTSVMVFRLNHITSNFKEQT